MKFGFRKFSFGDIIILAFLFAISCGGRGGSVSQPREVEVVQVTKGIIEQRVLFTGNIVAEAAFDVFPRATGKVSKKLLKEGDTVKRGKAILLVDRDEVGYTFRPMPVVSPADGLVGRILADVGTEVDSQTPVAVVVRPGKMRVKLDVPERYLNAILPGTIVSMRVDYLDGETFEGRIVTLSPVIDQKTRTGRIEVELPNEDNKLKHGMFGRINLVVERHDGVLVVPLGSVSWEGNKEFVLKVADGRVMRAEVKTGLRNDTHVEVLAGVAEGDTLVIGELIELKEGEVVTVRQ